MTKVLHVPMPQMDNYPKVNNLHANASRNVLLFHFLPSPLNTCIKMILKWPKNGKREEKNIYEYFP
jgi:hypothetical protein